MSDDQRVAVWMDHYHAPYAEVCDTEQRAADFAAAVESNGESSVAGVQFPDGRLVHAERWAAFAEARERLLAAQKLRDEEFAANPPPVREVEAPFGLGTAVVSPDDPDWLGVR